MALSSVCFFHAVCGTHSRPLTALAVRIRCSTLWEDSNIISNTDKDPMSINDYCFYSVKLLEMYISMSGQRRISVIMYLLCLYHFCHSYLLLKNACFS